MTGARAVTREPPSRLAEGELTYLRATPVDAATAADQHARYRKALADRGLDVIVLPPLDDHPDCAFVEDVAVCLPECVVICRPGAESRRGEVDSVAEVLVGDRPVHAIGAPATIDGGDVLVIGDTVYVGRSGRTDDRAISALGRILDDYGYAVTGVAVGAALHLKTAVTAVAEDLLVANPDWVDVAAFGARRVVPVAPDEPFGANTLTVGPAVLVQERAPRTSDAVARLVPLDVVPVEIGEFAKVEAGLTCLSIMIPPAGPTASRPETTSIV